MLHENNAIIQKVRSYAQKRLFGRTIQCNITIILLHVIWRFYMSELETLRNENEKLKQEIEELKQKIQLANEMNSNSFRQMLDMGKTISYYEDVTKVQRYKPWD